MQQVWADQSRAAEVQPCAAIHTATIGSRGGLVAPPAANGGLCRSMQAKSTPHRCRFLLLSAASPS